MILKVILVLYNILFINSLTYLLIPSAPIKIMSIVLSALFLILTGLCLFIHSKDKNKANPDSGSPAVSIALKLASEIKAEPLRNIDIKTVFTTGLWRLCDGVHEYIRKKQENYR